MCQYPKKSKDREIQNNPDDIRWILILLVRISGLLAVRVVGVLTRHVDTKLFQRKSE